MSQVSFMNKPRPPLVTFELMEKEDRNATIKEGRYMAISVPMVHIVPLGDNGKSKVTREAKIWLAEIKAKSLEQMYDPEWVALFHAAYAAWEKGEALPEVGTPIKTWPPLTPGEQKMILSNQVYTVEDLGGLTDTACLSLGMGWMGWRDKARNWLAAANDTGKMAAQHSALQVEHAQLQAQFQEMMEANRAMASRLDVLEQENAPKRRGRPPKQDDDIEALRT